MEAPATKEFISDYEARKLLGLDEFSLLNLILDFDLIPYRKKADAPDDYEIAHDFYEPEPDKPLLGGALRGPLSVLFEIGSLVFKWAAVDTYAKVRRSALERLQIQRSNVVHLQDDRTVSNMPPLPRLDSALEYIEKRIERTKSIPPEPENELQGLLLLAHQEANKIYDEIRDYAGLTKSAQANPSGWKKAALRRFHENKEEFVIIQEKHLSNDYLYSLTSGHEKRDFLNRLVSMALKDRGHEVSERKVKQLLKTINQR